MAFGYRYLMVYLPGIDPDSFLLFVHNPAGSTKLRSYLSGREHVIGQKPPLQMVLRDTRLGSTRHECDAHKTDDPAFWYQKTLELNRRFLGTKPPNTIAAPHTTPPKETATQSAGRAARGSQRQLQDYVNIHPDKLSNAVLELLPDRVRELGASIRWVSPLAREDYREYRDAEFLDHIGLGSFARELAEFWPGMGPSWDALGIISDSLGKMKPGVILVEAKSHTREIYGSGCQASPQSRRKIENAIGQARAWCGASGEEDWLGPLYQAANRIAHLYFLREQLRSPTWMVNLYFTGDPICPTDRSMWDLELSNVKTHLGLTGPVPGLTELYLPALNGGTSHQFPE